MQTATNPSPATEKGARKGPDRTLSLTTPGAELRPCRASRTTGTAAARNRLVWRRPSPSATEHRAAGKRERASQGRDGSRETTQGRRFIARSGLSRWRTLCCPCSPVQHRSCCCGAFKTRPQAIHLVAVCRKARSPASASAACSSRFVWWNGITPRANLATTVDFWWFERRIQQPVFQRGSSPQALALCWP